MKGLELPMCRRVAGRPNRVICERCIKLRWFWVAPGSREGSARTRFWRTSMRLILMAALAAGLTFLSHLGQAQDRSDSNRNVLGPTDKVVAALSPESHRHPAEG